MYRRVILHCVYIVLHKETLERPSGVLATATALLVTFINFVFRLQSLKCFLIPFFLPGDVNLDPARLFKMNHHNPGDNESRLYNTLTLDFEGRTKTSPQPSNKTCFFKQKVVRPLKSLPEYVVRSDNVSDFNSSLKEKNILTILSA